MGNKLLLTLAVLMCFYSVFPQAASSPDSNPTVAVLGFENKSTFDRLDAFEIALPYMLISDLSKISSIQLVERDKIDNLMAETGLAEKDLMDSATVQRIGNVLGADIIIIGHFCEEVESGQSVEESSLSITLDLKNVRTGNVIKKIQVEGKSKEFYILEKQLVESLTEVLKLRLAPEEVDSIHKIATRSLEAVIHFARGKKLQYKAAQYYGQKKYGAEDTEKLLLRAMSEFKQSLYLDPEYADAQFELTLVPLDEIAELPWAQKVKYKELTVTECEEFVKRFSDDPSRCADILIKLGYMYHIGTYPYTDHDKAISCYRKVIFQYNYKGSGPVEALVGAYFGKGDYGKAIEMCQFLIERYPNGEKPGYYSMFRIYNGCEQYGKALEVLEYIEKNELFKGLSHEKKTFEKNFPHVYVDDLLTFRKFKGDFYVKMGRIDEAVGEWEGMIDQLRRLPGDKWSIWGGGGTSFELQSFWYDLAKAYRAVGKEDKAIHYFQETTCAPTDDPRQSIQSYYDLGKLYQKKEEWLKALRAYEKLLALGNPRREFVDKDMEICRRNLGIRKPQTIKHWVPYLLFPKFPRKVKVNEVTNYIYEQYGPAALVKQKDSLYFALKYNRCTRHKHKELGWHQPVIEKAKESGWYVCQVSLSGEQKSVYKIPDIFKIEYITDIAVDDSNIWLASGNSGVIRFDRKNEKWTQYTTSDGLSHNTVWGIALTPERVWFGFGDKGRGGISEYDIRTGEWRVHWHERISCAVTALAVEGSQLWVGTGDGTIAILDLQDKSWEIIRGKEGYGHMGYHPMVTNATSPDCSTVRDIQIQEGQVWFACGGVGIKKYDIKTGEWKEWKLLEVKLADGTLRKVEACCLGIDKDTVWIGDGGIYALNIRTGQGKGPDIDFWDINFIVVDHNVIWFAGNGGIMRFFKNGVENEVD